MPSSPGEPTLDAPGAGGDRLWVVLPVYNEAAAIERVIREWIPALELGDPHFVLLVVDDGSTDDTPAILERLARADPRLRIETEPNRGHGGACRRGYQIATGAESDAAWILQIDSDGQCDASDFAAFWKGRSEHPLQLGQRRREDGLLRTATSRALALLVSAAAGRWIRDPNVPFRLMRRDVLTRALPLLPATGVDLLNTALSVVSAEIVEVHWVAVRFRPRFAGQSHYRMARMGRLAAALLSWLVARRFRARDQPPGAPVALLAALAWCALLTAIVLYGARNLGEESIWFDESMQVHTSLGVYPMAAPFTPVGSLREVVTRNRDDELDPGGFGIFLHYWLNLFGTSALALRACSGLLVVTGLLALAALAKRWIDHPLAPPAAVAVALIDPLIREHALEIRPYALEMAAVWIAFWSADRMLARPRIGRAIVLGLALAALVGSRYSGFFTAGAIAAALYLQRWPEAAGDIRLVVSPAVAKGSGRRRPALVLLAMLPSLVALLAIARWAVPGLIRRSTFNDGELVEYLQAYTLGALPAGQAVIQALRNLADPAVLGLTFAAVLALWPATDRSRARVRLRDALTPAPASIFVRRTALAVLVFTIVAWRWHPWNPSTKWSLYLHLVSIVCLLRLAADVLPLVLRHRDGGRAVARRTVAVAALALVAGGAGLTASTRRGRADVAFPALVRVGDLVAEGGVEKGAVAVDLHPFPAVRYHYEFGALRGAVEYPRAFLLPLRNRALTSTALCSARWLLSFESIDALERRFPGLRFERDPVARHLLSVTAIGPAASPGEAGFPMAPRCASE